MRTTIDIPDDLFRQVKASAALRGLKLKDLIAEMLEEGLAKPPSSALGHKRPIPVVIPSEYKVPALTNAQIEELLLQEELERVGKT